MANAQPALTDRSSPAALFYLPDELLVQIVSHLAADKPTLCSLARTCRFFQSEAEKHLYNSIELLSTNDLHAIIEAFTRRPERIASVETLKILYRFHSGLGATAEERGLFNQCVKIMKALRHWEIESPYDNYKWDHGGDEWVLGDMEEFRAALENASLKAQGGALAAVPDAGLAKLERLTIHTHGVSDDFWNLGGYHCLFRHPALRYLHVSCLALPSDLPELEPYAKSTPLTELIFDECEIERQSLGRILATPKRLKRLTLGENVYNINEGRGANPRLTRAPEASLAALKHAAHSLESLTHYDPSWRLNVDTRKHSPIPGDGMRDFHSLTSLRVDACSFLHRCIVLSHAQAPPNLATLQIRHPRQRLTPFGLSGASNLEDFFERLPPYDPYTYLPSLKTLDFVQGASLEDYGDTVATICEEEALRERHAIGFKLRQYGINLRVTLEATWKGGLIPPVLHGEPPPELLCLYDAEVVGFNREPTDEERSAYESVHGVGEEPPATETDQLHEDFIHVFRSVVDRKMTALYDRMRIADDPLDYPGTQTWYTIVDDSGEDDGIWGEFDDNDDWMDDMQEEIDELDDEFHDAEEHNLELALHEINAIGLTQEELAEFQAHVLLTAAAAAEDDIAMEEQLMQAEDEHSVD